MKEQRNEINFKHLTLLRAASSACFLASSSSSDNGSFLGSSTGSSSSSSSFLTAVGLHMKNNKQSLRNSA